MDNTFNVLPGVVRPDYTIYRFDDWIYKIVYNKSTIVGMRLVDKKEQQHYADKLEASLSRSRRAIVELGMCNNWKYFCTFTLDKERYNRHNLGKWQKDFSQWLRDQRKKYDNQIKFDYLLIPERHADGAWHMHGFFGDISSLLVSFKELRQRGVDVPDKLVNNGYFNWLDCQRKFGFCSFGLIGDRMASALYATKYATKDNSRNVTELGGHLYYASHGLLRPTQHCQVYGRVKELDCFLTEDYEFCKTGFVRTSSPDWSYAFEYSDFSNIEAFNSSDQSSLAEAEADKFYEFVQVSLYDQK